MCDVPRPLSPKEKLMKISKSMILSAALMFAAGGAALAAQTSAQTTTTKTSANAHLALHKEMGTVSSLTNSEMVLTHTVKGKQEKTTFKLDSNTKKEGTIDKGTHVAVYFKDQNHERIATEIKAEPTKS
jgi:hypothetical protein